MRYIIFVVCVIGASTSCRQAAFDRDATQGRRAVFVRQRVRELAEAFHAREHVWPTSIDQLNSAFPSDCYALDYPSRKRIAINRQTVIITGTEPKGKTCRIKMLIFGKFKESDEASD